MDDPRKHDPHLSEGGMTAVIWAETALAACCVSMRLVFRIAHRDRLTWDDGIVALAMLCMITMNALLTPVIPAIYTLRGLMTGMLKEPPPDFTSSTGRYLRHQFAAIILFWSTLWSVKLSFLIFYKQLFSSGYNGWQRWGWWSVAGFCIVTYIANVVLQFFACQPLWTYFQVGYCSSAQDIAISNSSLYLQTATDVVCDILIMIMPLSILRDLHMKVRAKFALGALFGTGAIIVLFALLRLFFTLPQSNSQVNPEWLALWSSTEAMVAVAVSCAPAFRKYFAGTRRSPTMPVRLSSGPSSRRPRPQMGTGALKGHSPWGSGSEQSRSDRSDGDSCMA